MSNKTHEAVRKALIEKAGNGNKSYIREQDIIDHDGFSTSWEWYDDLLCRFETEARNFVGRAFDLMAINEGLSIEEAVKERDSKLDEYNENIIKLKKEMLEVIDPEHEHHCTKYDGAIIGMFAHGTEAMANNVSGDKDFRVEVQDTFASRAKFRHAIEGYFGRIILKNGMMSPERATYLRKERELLRKLKGSEKTIDRITSDITGLKSSKDKVPGGAAYFDEAIGNLRKQLKGAEAAKVKAEKALKNFYKTYTLFVTPEPTIQEVMSNEKKKEDEMSDALKKAEAMTKKEKMDLLDEHGIKYRKAEKSEDLNERVANLIMAIAEQSEPEQQEAETEKVAEPEQATAEAK